MKNYNIKKILVPFDFTHNALNALKVADKMAIEFNARVDLLNLIEPYVTMHPMGFSPAYPQDLYAYTCESKSVIQKYLSNNSIYPEAYTYIVEYGFYASSIISKNRTEHYDLIILPTRETGFISQISSKYNPLKIMELTGTPVISVGKYYRIIDFQNIILPIRNVSNWYEKLPFMISLVKRTGGKIHAVGLRESEKESKIQFNTILDEAVSILEKENLLSSVNIFEGSDALYKLKIFSDVQKADLIAVTPPIKSKPVVSLFKPSVFNRLVSDSPAPVFGVNPIP